MRPQIATTQLGGIANLALIAPVKPGFVDGYETVSHARRLELLLKTLNGIRLTAREAATAPSPVPDTVGRFGIIHAFRYALVPPEADPAPTPAAASEAPRVPRYRLLLNVSFDGGWEPYMRVIYRDLGTLLDTIFCNCVGYLDSRSHGFDDYIRWVRGHEIAGGLFYNESSMTVLDQRYLAGIEKIHRETGNTKAADRQSTEYVWQQRSVEDALTVTDDDSQAEAEAKAAAGAAALKLQLKALKVLHDLRPVYPKNASGDDQTLLRFAQVALQDLPKLLPAPTAGAPQLPPPIAEALRWFMSRPDEIRLPQRERAYVANRIQAGILSRHDGVTHGCLVLLRVTEAAAAREALAALPVNAQDEPPSADGIHRNLAISLPGLAALGVPAWRIDRFPQEFVEGMEARAGLLGDVRGNHPTAWRRPRLYGAALPVEIELSAVHLVVQLRLVDRSNPGHALHPRLAAEIDQLAGLRGLAVLAVEEMRSWPDKLNTTREHFGFRDGISQPLADDAPPAQHWSDRVERGELLLGYPSARHGGVYPREPDALLDDGCFLALRKIRQRVDVLDDVLKRLIPGQDGAFDARIKLTEQLMGRKKEGGPLVTKHDATSDANPNDFDYEKDAQGQHCPFHSHARRSNPRNHRRDGSDGGPPVPSIVRRGMSYGPRSLEDRSTERGVVFMAYCADLAEQFEVVQRWLTGGNSSGGLSTLSDPLLGVPEPGDPRVFRFVDGSGDVVRRPLGDRQFTELQWGMYLFVPSLPALRGLAAITAEAPPPPRPPDLPKTPSGPSAGFTAWQQGLEDPALRDRTWQQVARAPGGVLDTEYGRLVADPAQITAVLQDDGRRFSVAGYGQRLGLSVGLGYLGLDLADGHDAQAETPRDEGVNQAIADIGVEEAYGAAIERTAATLDAFKKAARPPTPTGRPEVAIDLAELSETVLGLLCRHWFGLPDSAQRFMVLGGRTTKHDGPARCPGHFFSVARYVFSAYPSATVTDDAQAHGRAVRSAVGDFLQAARDDPRSPQPGPLAQKIAARLQSLQGTDPGIVTRTVAGTLLGFPPTVHSNFLRVMKAWLQTGAEPASAEAVTQLWPLQAELLAGGGGAIEFARASEVLAVPLLAQMRKAPVPEAIWRQLPAEDGGEPRRVVLGLAAAMRNPAAHDRLMFGGARIDRAVAGLDGKGAAPTAASQRVSSAGAADAAAGREPADPPQTVHGCPGYEMAIGVLLGMITAILLAGTVRPTASGTVINLVLTDGQTPA